MNQFNYQQGVEKGKKLFPYTFSLTLVFLILKLAGYITWSWWLVFLPLYLGLALVLALVVVFILLALFGLIVTAIVE